MAIGGACQSGAVCNRQGLVMGSLGAVAPSYSAARVQYGIYRLFFPQCTLERDNSEALGALHGVAGKLQGVDRKSYRL